MYRRWFLILVCDLPTACTLVKPGCSPQCSYQCAAAARLHGAAGSVLAVVVPDTISSAISAVARAT